MNAKGHESVAYTAGIPLLQETLEARGQKGVRLAALYFGNWLADVSQLVDPVATDAGAKAAKESIDKCLDELASTDLVKRADKLLGLADLPRIKALLPELKRELNSGVDRFILAKNDTRRSELDNLVRTGLRISGYFKFAYPPGRGKRAPMDASCFFQIFECMFTQYYPHEHLDRPEVLPSKNPPQYVMDKDTGTRATGTSLNPDLYHYLRDDIEMIAAWLCEVDRDWARKFLAPNATVDDTKLEWNLGLAKLGRALHGVEDFFAHSNFIEYATLMAGKGFLSWDDPNPDRWRFVKRLRAYIPASYPNWHDYPKESYVVSGYFDARDTIISMSHIAEELFGIEANDPAQKLIYDIFEYVEDPRKALRDKENEVAKKLAKKYPVDKFRRPPINRFDVQEILKESPFFTDVDSKIRAEIVNYVIKATEVGQFGISTYKAYKTIMKFVKDPIEWLLDWLSEQVKELFKDAIIHYTKERFYDYVGQDRIGCHSLLAKDHGDEWLYDHMKSCATAVHWYIVKRMTRWGDPDFRRQIAESQSKKWINWLELLEFFLRHPQAGQLQTNATEIVAVDIIHVVKDGDTLENLPGKYQSKAIRPGSLTWRTIVDANFNTCGKKPDRLKCDEPNPKTVTLTSDGQPSDDAKFSPRTLVENDSELQKIVNKILADNNWGYPVRLTPNYAFNNGLHVIIPNQKEEVEVIDMAPEGIWFIDVMKKQMSKEKDGWTVFRGYEDSKTKKSMPGKNYHNLVYFEDKKDKDGKVSSYAVDQLKEQIKHGNDLRKKAEKAYRPQGSADQRKP